MLVDNNFNPIEPPEWYKRILMPYPCSHFYFDIKFGDRLYSKEKKRAWPVLF